MWRYAPAFPARGIHCVAVRHDFSHPTPRWRASRAGRSTVKNEGLNPTGSFRPWTFLRDLDGRKLGSRRAIPSRQRGEPMAAMRSGGSSRTSYAPTVPQSNYIECKAFGRSTLWTG